MEIAVNLMGGLGLFLYGMNLMGDGLQKSAGDKLTIIVNDIEKTYGDDIVIKEGTSYTL